MHEPLDFWVEPRDQILKGSGVVGSDAIERRFKIEANGVGVHLGESGLFGAGPGPTSMFRRAPKGNHAQQENGKCCRLLALLEVVVLRAPFHEPPNEIVQRSRVGDRTRLMMVRAQAVAVDQMPR